MAHLCQQQQQGLAHLTMLGAQLGGITRRQEPAVQIQQTLARRSIPTPNPGRAVIGESHQRRCLQPQGAPGQLCLQPALESPFVREHAGLNLHFQALGITESSDR